MPGAHRYATPARAGPQQLAFKFNRPAHPSENMGQETITYLTNIVIAVILAGLITHHWLRQGRTKAMGYWMLAAWTMAVADGLFAARPDLPHWLGRFAPTLLVTLGHAVLYLGARITARQTQPWKPALALVAAHAAGLVYFLLLDEPSRWRMVFNGALWAGLSLASFLALRRAPQMFWRPLASPANVFLLHALFHGLRIALAVLFAVRGWEEAAASLQIIGDLEVSFFMVALFVGLLIANLQQRHEELSCAHAEVATLSGLLPICAWCKKVRDDDGYWRQVEDYFATRSQIEFTHGMCADCFETQKSLAPKT
jgi:hypothetical protein